MVYVKNFQGKNDSERINNAILERDIDGTVVIEPKENGEPWLLDSAILLPENTMVIIRNCKLKLSDNCRDNFFRSANCGLGIDVPKRIKNIHIIGEGRAILEGADYPRAVGDSSKVLANPCPFDREDLCRYADWIPAERKESGNLNGWDAHSHSFGTDAGKENESQYGDWRGIGVLFASVDDFSIENIRIVKPHCWSISLEDCTHGKVRGIDFDACMNKMIDGMRQNMENQDGIDIRNGCNHIEISDITGMTGDDVIALTAIATRGKEICKGGSLRSTHVLSDDWDHRDGSIHDITIRNIRATSSHCWVVRLLPVKTQIYNVLIDGILDGGQVKHHGTVLLGENGYGATLDGQREYMQNVIVTNVISNANSHAISIGEWLQDSIINNVIYMNKNGKAIVIDGENLLKNVVITNVQTNE